MEKIIRDEPMEAGEGILHHDEGVDLIPANIELSGMEIMLVNAMSREFTMKSYLSGLKKDYDYILIDCMPSLGIFPSFASPIPKFTAVVVLPVPPFWFARAITLHLVNCNEKIANEIIKDCNQKGYMVEKTTN